MSFIRTLDEFELSETGRPEYRSGEFQVTSYATPSKSAFTLPSSGTLVALPDKAPDFGSQPRSFFRQGLTRQHALD
jgi:hypothetical protein